MNVSKTQWIEIIRLVIVCVLAISAVIGYDLGVIAPREEALVEQAVTNIYEDEARRPAPQLMPTVVSAGLAKEFRYGVATGVVNDRLIAHGFATTPTVVLLTASPGMTASVSAIGPVSFTVHSAGTVPTLYWGAGR